MGPPGPRGGPASHPLAVKPLVLAASSDVARVLPLALHRARAAWQAAAGTCRSCGRAFSPGHMHEQDLCQGCAERELGVDY